MLAIFAMAFGIPSESVEHDSIAGERPLACGMHQSTSLAPDLTCRGSDGDSPNNGPLRPARRLDRNMSTLRLFIRV